MVNTCLHLVVNFDRIVHILDVGGDLGYPLFKVEHINGKLCCIWTWSSEQLRRVFHECLVSLEIRSIAFCVNR